MASTAAVTEDQPNAVDADTPTIPSCLNDPNYAIICVFLQKFAVQLKIEHPDFAQLQQMIENTDEVHEDLKNFLVKLLRKSRKSVQPDKLNTALVKFCYTYSLQDGWEIERFGYQKASLGVKLRLIKEILENQFEKNPQFRSAIGAQSGNDLRSHPLGKDKLGNAYWSTLDEQCNLRIYQEHLDEEIWKPVASNRDELVKLIACLKGNELVMPSLVGLVDEDSSSNSMSLKVDALNGAAVKTEVKAETEPEVVKNGNSLNIKIKLKTASGEAEVKTETMKIETPVESVTTETINEAQQQQQPSLKRLSLMASKKSSPNAKAAEISPSKEKLGKRTLEVDEETEVRQTKRPSLLTSKTKHSAKNSRYTAIQDDDADSGSEELEEEEDEDSQGEEEEYAEEEEESEESGEEIEEPTMYVRGEGSGKANKCGNALHSFEITSDDSEDDCGVGEAIEEDVIYFTGLGAGHDCDVGNNEPKSDSSTETTNELTTKAVTETKPLFFFGQPGCLKLSPMKTISSTKPKADANDASKVNDKAENSTTGESTSSVAGETEPKITPPVDNTSDAIKSSSSIGVKGANDGATHDTPIETIENDADENKSTEEVNDTQPPTNALNSPSTTVDAIRANVLDEVDRSSAGIELCLDVKQSTSNTNSKTERMIDMKTAESSATISMLTPESVLYEKTEEHHAEAINSVLNTEAPSENEPEELSTTSEKVDNESIKEDPESVAPATEVTRSESSEQSIISALPNDESELDPSIQLSTNENTTNDAAENESIENESKDDEPTMNNATPSELSNTTNKIENQIVNNDNEAESLVNNKDSRKKTGAIDRNADVPADVVSKMSCSAEQSAVSSTHNSAAIPEALAAGQKNETESLSQDAEDTAGASIDDVSIGPESIIEAPPSEALPPSASDAALSHNVESTREEMPAASFASENVEPINDLPPPEENAPAIENSEIPDELTVPEPIEDANKFEKSVGKEMDSTEPTDTKADSENEPHQITETIADNQIDSRIDESKSSESKSSMEINSLKENVSILGGTNTETVNDTANAVPTDEIPQSSIQSPVATNESTLEIAPKTVELPERCTHYGDEVKPLLNNAQLTECSATSHDSVRTEPLKAEELRIPTEDDQNNAAAEIDEMELKQTPSMIAEDVEALPGTVQATPTDDQTPVRPAEVANLAAPSQIIPTNTPISENTGEQNSDVHIECETLISNEPGIGTKSIDEQHPAGTTSSVERSHTKITNNTSEQIDNIDNMNEKTETAVEEQPGVEIQVAEPGRISAAETLLIDNTQEEIESVANIEENDEPNITGNNSINDELKSTVPPLTPQPADISSQHPTPVDLHQSKVTINHEKRKASQLDALESNESKKICEEGEIKDQRSLLVIQNAVDVNTSKVTLPTNEPNYSTQNSLQRSSASMLTDLTQPSPIEAHKTIEIPVYHSTINLSTTAEALEKPANAELPTKAVETETPVQNQVSQPIVETARPKRVDSIVSILQAKAAEQEHTQIEGGATNSMAKTSPVPEKSNSSSDTAIKYATAQSTAKDKPTQRTRKRRLSGEKVRLSSESDGDNFDSFADSPGINATDDSADEDVGGKRLKIRARVPMRNTRKVVELQRNVRSTDLSSDDDGRPIVAALRTTPPKANKNISAAPQIEKVADKSTKEVLPTEKLATASKNAPESEQPATEETSKTEPSAGSAELEPPLPVTVTTPETSVEEISETKSKRPGRPPRKNAAAANQQTQASKRAAAIPTEQEEAPEAPKAESVEEKPSPKAEPRKKRRSLLGLDITEDAIIPSNLGDAPVRQSRRIAQLKIKEEAERRKEEEIALKKLKEASEKKKKGGGTTERHKSDSDYSQGEESASEVELKVGKKKRKGKKDRPWQTDSSDSSERDEEDNDEHYEMEHRLPPLKSDHEFSPESDIEDEAQVVPTKRARTARKDKAEVDAEEEIQDDRHACQKCSKHDHPEWILLCDKCDKGYHCSCLIPVLFVIPEGDWFCPPCQQEKLIVELENMLTTYDALVKKRDAEEAQRQRILFTSINEANVLAESKRDKRRAERAGRETDSDEDDSSSSSDDDRGSERKSRRGGSRRGTGARKSATESSATNSSDDEPIYKLRKRRQTNVSYRFNEYDELINRAIRSDMDEAAGVGNAGRGKDISTIFVAEKEEKRGKHMPDEDESEEEEGEKESEENKPKGKHISGSEEDSDSEPIRPRTFKGGNKRKKKLNSLDIDSEDDGSDDDFKTSSLSEEDEEENYSGASSGDSDSSLDSIARRGRGRGGSSRRPVRERRKRFDADFIDDNTSNTSDDVPLIKKKKKVESDFSEFNDDSTDDEEDREDMDSDDLCDDSTDESDGDWRKKKKRPKPPAKSTAVTVKPSQPKKKVKRKEEGEKAFRGVSSKGKKALASDDDAEEVLPKSRRTRGKKLSYLLEEELESSDDGIKPGVKRPDTPPEERAAFIQRQEEIKRMLAAQNTEGAKALAAPMISSIPTPEKSRKAPPKDSLSTIPLQVIQAAKALDVDLKKNVASKMASDESDGFDDDLPEDFDPEEMDEDEIAKMMEEEDFAQHQLKLAGEAIRNKKLKEKKDVFGPKMPPELDPRIPIPPNSIPPIQPNSMPPNSIPPSAIPPNTIPPILNQGMLAQLSPSLAGPPALLGLPYQNLNQPPAIPPAKTVTTPKKRGRKIKDDSIMDAVKTSRPIDGQRPPIDHPSHLPPMYLSPHGPPIHLRPHAQAQHLPSGAPIPHGPPHPQGVPIPQPPLHHVAQPPHSISHAASVISHSSMLHPRPPQSHQVHPLAAHPPQAHPPSSQSHPPSSILGIAHSQEQIIPTTVLAVQNTRLLDPSELGQPPDSLLESPGKKRGRRKKFTPTRDSLVSPPTTTPKGGMDLTSTPPTTASAVDPPKGSILSERLGAIPDNKRGLSVAPPAQLYSPPTSAQPSVITRLLRPPPGPQFPPGQSQPPHQRFYPQGHQLPPHTIPSSHSRPSSYHPSNITVTAGHRPPPLVNQPTGSAHLPHPMYMRGQPSIYGAPGYPPGPPPPMHRSLQAMESAGSPYHNSPYGGFYPHGAPSDRRPTMLNTFEQYDNISKNSPSPHDRSTPNAYHPHGLPPHHPGVVSALAGSARHPDDDDERSPRSAGAGSGSTSAGGGSSSEFSGLVSYFSSQQDDLDS